MARAIPSRSQGLALAVAAVMAGLTPAAAADLHGLHIGIDDYIGTTNDLLGATNDAKDITSVMQKLGAKSVTTILNKDATKAKISAAWTDLITRAAPGDTIVLTYSGHGSQEKEPEGRREEADGMNENFLLAGFNPTGPGRAERIVDDEMFLWLKQADEKGLRVIFAADACHSGTMNRDVRAGAQRYRMWSLRDFAGEASELPATSEPTLTPEGFRFLTFISSTSDDRLTPEIKVKGQWRGALSWSLARGLEGRADQNRDGVISQAELLNFLVGSVHSLVESQQTPQIEPLQAGNLPVLAFAGSSGSGAGGAAGAAEARVTVAVVGGARAMDGLSGVPKGVTATDNQAEADLIYDADKGTIDHRVGGRVAENIRPDQAGPIFAKFETLAWLKAVAAVDPVSARVVSGNQAHAKGERVQIRIDGARLPYLTLFNLPPDGRVEFYLPDGPDAAKKSYIGQAIQETFQVDKPPYGAEHMVAIFSAEVLTSLHQALRQMGSADRAAALPDVLPGLLEGKDIQVGVLDIYTKAQ